MPDIYWCSPSISFTGRYSAKFEVLPVSASNKNTKSSVVIRSRPCSIHKLKGRLSDRATELHSETPIAPHPQHDQQHARD